jgi:hypothetical protein
MKDIVEGFGLFFAVYTLWNLLKRGVFFEWDLSGFVWSAVVVGIVVALRHRLFGVTKGKLGMSHLPVGVGNADAQRRFLDEHEAFLGEWRELHRMLEKVFIRTLGSPTREEIERLNKLPDSDPAVIAFEDRVMADRVIFYLGRIAADDFAELLILAGNGFGIGAYKILRGMYERIVTAAFIAKNASEARVFIEHDPIQRWKLWQRFVGVMPGIKSRYSADQIAGLEQQHEEAKAKRAVSHCKKCGQPITAETWTRVDLETRAKKADSNLAELYAACYSETTLHSHATIYGLTRRLRPVEGGGWTYGESTVEDARLALHLGHNLVLQLLALQNDHFKLGLDSEIRARIEMFSRVWHEPQAASRR